MKRLFFTLLLLLLPGIRLMPDAGRLRPSLEGLADLQPHLVNALRHNRQCTQWVDSVLQDMTLRERIGQLFIYTIAPQQTQHGAGLHTER